MRLRALLRFSAMFWFKMLKFSVLVAFLLVDQTIGQSSGACQTPYNENGACIPIRDCASIWRIVTEAPRPLDQRVLQFLQKSTCGNPSERRVCCRLQDVSGGDAGAATVEPPSSDTISEVVNHPNLNQLDRRSCGPISSDRIAHGNETVLFEFPWMALLGYEDSGSGIDYRCGGAVINKR